MDVLPPDEAASDNGARAYRCIAHMLTGRQSRTSSSAGKAVLAPGVTFRPANRAISDFADH
jgi:hypothetical protein